MHFDLLPQSSNVSTSNDDPIEMHWHEAAILASLSGTEPIWGIVLPHGIEINRLRRVARKWLDQETRDQKLLEHRLIECGCDRFCDFVGHWLVTDFIQRRPTDEIITVLFSTTRRDPKVAKFWAEALSVPDIGLRLMQDRNADTDEQILLSIDKFEVAVARGGNDAWEENFMRGMSFNPFVDLTYPIYRGFIDHSMYKSAKKIFAKKIDPKSFKVLLQHYQTQFGPLEYPDSWERLIK